MQNVDNKQIGGGNKLSRNRVDIIASVGRTQLQSNIENDEWSYNELLKKKKIDRKLVTVNGTVHKNLDLRFVDDRVSVLIETKQNYDTCLEAAKQQLQCYVEFEKVLTRHNRIIAILANTNDNRIMVWRGDVCEENFLKEETELQNKQWKKFRITEIFTMCNGFYNTKPIETDDGDIPFVGASAVNNGITSWHKIEDIESAPKAGNADKKLGKNQSLSQKLFDGNCICVTNNGSVGYAQYQEFKFTCSHDVNPLYPNPAMGWTMNKYNALFLCGVIEQERFRWAYGRKWRPSRMKESVISLPVDSAGKPDWQFMEDYIKGVMDEEKIRLAQLDI